jgi:parallel beta-helix repeat protein
MNRVVFSREMNRLLAPAAFVAAVVALVAVGSVQARSGGETAVSCGQTLKASVRLADDLADCPGSGLIIGANGITVDLNGHTIDGTNNRKPGIAGVVNDKHANVTIENGAITDFYFAGVSVSGSRGVVLRKLTVSKVGAGCKQGDQCAGIFLMQATGTTISDSSLSNNVQSFQVNGIDVYASPGTLVQRSRIDRNAGHGVAVFQSPRSRFVGNGLEGNRLIGLQVNSSSDSTLVTGNRARGNRTAGIAVGASSNLRVLDNTVSGNGEVGLLLFDLTGSLVRGNRASGNPNGIVLYGGQADVAGYAGKHGATRNELVANKATKNTRSGILVRGDGGKDVADDNLLSGNVANGNGRNGGIVLQGSASGNKLRTNTANANAGHGITATRGTIDAGGNRAHGNHRSPQCVGVVCR